MQIKTVKILSYSSHNGCHQGNQKQILVRIGCGKESVYTAAANINWLYQYKSIWKFFKKTRNGTNYYPPT